MLQFHLPQASGYKGYAANLVDDADVAGVKFAHVYSG